MAKFKRRWALWIVPPLAIAVAAAIAVGLSGEGDDTGSAAEAAGPTGAQSLGLSCSSDELIVSTDFDAAYRGGGPTTPDEAVAAALENHFVGVDVADTRVLSETSALTRVAVLNGGSPKAVLRLQDAGDHWSLSGYEACSDFANQHIHRYRSQGGNS